MRIFRRVSENYFYNNMLLAFFHFNSLKWKVEFSEVTCDNVILIANRLPTDVFLCFVEFSIEVDLEYQCIFRDEFSLFPEMILFPAIFAYTCYYFCNLVIVQWIIIFVILKFSLCVCKSTKISNYNLWSCFAIIFCAQFH